MEELLGLILELILEILLYSGADFVVIPREEEEGFPFGWMTLFFLLGAGLGAIANLVQPRFLLPYPWLRVINLIVGPLIVGGIARAWTKWRRRRGRKLVPRNHFAFAFLFTFAFDLVRFVYAKP